MDIIVLSAAKALDYRTINPVYAIRIFDWYESCYNPRDKQLTLPADSIVVSYKFEEYDRDFYNQQEVSGHYGERIKKLQERAFNNDIAKDLITHFRDNRDGKLELLVHCQAGLERSPSVAQALNDLFELSEDYNIDRVRKNFIYRTMMRVGLEIL